MARTVFPLLTWPEERPCGRPSTRLTMGSRMARLCMWCTSVQRRMHSSRCRQRDPRLFPSPLLSPFPSLPLIW
ncbi:hypothetical protein ATCV1_z653L [Acanthocystis turfacea chlorella virus 1]|uniref:Uncharacterized protein z653L n=1 Tax=Chlorovirus heliozoae TaxID=322019 RepID=A7K9R3_9PHYC|nr:hypothetical protein ATCV1_z653L [Acanthocystis turfacea chlorella virus 1]ABT16787.1 hypothetical protein ATCV1_z653L [Acanthocystis turfacea chlorella virus 1]